MPRRWATLEVADTRRLPDLEAIADRYPVLRVVPSRDLDTQEDEK